MVLETFRMTPKPHSYRRQALSQVIRHSLLRCTNQNCRVPMVNDNGDADNRGYFRLWNRDLPTCLNMLHIVRSVRESCQIPDRFGRNVPQQLRRPGRYRGHSDDLQYQCTVYHHRNQ
ncbi:hypothetical protein G6F37_006392 [Rhizopus arrhizus]|nr:hypothetical protein G6F38_011218 [Rhizopus arrhizus]KAG1157786.1 hypothetical protein G6F37_006392 [Rhizopus arrhizus]